MEVILSEFQVWAKKKTFSVCWFLLGYSFLGGLHDRRRSSAALWPLYWKTKLKDQREGAKGDLWSRSYSKSPAVWVIHHHLITKLKLGARESLCDDSSPSSYVTATSWETWEWCLEPREPPEPWEIIVINDYWLFHTTTFVVICYAVRDNRNCFKAVGSPDSFAFQ